MNATTTSWIVIGIGIVVSLIGWYMAGMTGAGVLGFGLAWIVLGILDMLRPAVQINEERSE